jgi:acyl carrier protein
MDSQNLSLNENASSTESERVKSALLHYVAHEVLDGRELGLDADTPLLEWGVINSMEVARLLAFIQREFGVVIARHELAPENLKDIRSITALVLRAHGA